MTDKKLILIGAVVALGGFALVAMLPRRAAAAGGGSVYTWGTGPNGGQGATLGAYVRPPVVPRGFVYDSKFDAYTRINADGIREIYT